MDSPETVQWGAGNGRRGQALVELALIFPVMLLLLLGALDLGRVFYANITITSAAKEAALRASSGAPDAAAVAANESRGGFVTVLSTNVTTTYSDATNRCSSSAAFGATVTATVTAPFQVITPYIGAFLGGQTKTLRAVATANCAVAPAAVIAAPVPCVPPTISFVGSPLSGNRPLSVAFTATSSGTPLSWAWVFGDGNTSTAQNPSNNYNANGNSNKKYDVSLTVTTAPSCSTTLTKATYINTNP